MAKESKKQIKAQLTNEISLRFKKRIDALETELRYVRSELRECDNQRRKAEHTILKLKEQLEKYQDWNRRLQEFMDMDPDSREEIIAQYRTSKELNDRFSNIFNMYERMFGMF